MYNKHNHLYMLQRSCGDLDGGESYDCDNPLQGGADPNLTLFNHDDILSFTYGAVPNLITGITLVNGKSGYKYEGFGTSVGPQVDAIAAASGQILSKHQVSLVVFSRTQLTKNRIQKIFNGTYAAGIRATTKDENAFEMYGAGIGMKLVPGTIHQLKENNGAYSLVLATPDGQFESKLPQTVYDGTSYATTRTMMENLWYQPAILNLTDLSLAAAGGDAVIVTGKNFFGGGGSSAVTLLQWQNLSTLAYTTQTSPTVSNDTTLNFSSVALTAGTYRLKITTTKGIAYSTVNVVVS